MVSKLNEGQHLNFFKEKIITQVKNKVKNLFRNVHHFQNGKPCFSFPHSVGKSIRPSLYCTAHVVTEGYDLLELYSVSVKYRMYQCMNMKLYSVFQKKYKDIIVKEGLELII